MANCLHVCVFCQSQVESATQHGGGDDDVQYHGDDVGDDVQTHDGGGDECHDDDGGELCADGVHHDGVRHAFLGASVY